jgi:hypothetical protein
LRRCAQDDGFVGGLEIQLIGYPENTRIEKVTGSQDDVFLEVLKKKIPNKLALMGLRPGLSSAVPQGLDFVTVVLTQTLNPL